MILVQGHDKGNKQAKGRTIIKTAQPNNTTKYRIQHSFFTAKMRRSRCDNNSKKDMMVSETPEVVRAGKRRRTILEAFHGMTLRTADSSHSDCNSSLATVGSMEQQHDDENDESLSPDCDKEEQVEDEIMQMQIQQIPSDQEQANQKIVYELVMGKQHKDVVTLRLEEMIRQTRLQANSVVAAAAAASKDDFNLELHARSKEDANAIILDENNFATTTTKNTKTTAATRPRSHSLPQHLEEAVTHSNSMQII